MESTGIDKQPSTTDRRIFFAVLWSGFLATLAVGMLSFSLPLVSLDAKVSGAWLGTGFAGYFLARLIAGPLGGLWADRVCPRAPLVWGFGLGALSPLAYLVAPSMSALFVVQFIMGAVSGLIRPVSLALLGGSREGEERDLWYRRHALLFNLAVFIGPLAGGILYLHKVMEPVLVGVAVCMVMGHLLVFARVPEQGSGRATNFSSQDEAEDKAGLYVLLVAIFGRTFGLGLLVAFYPVLLSLRLDVDSLTIGMLFAVSGLTTCLAVPLGAVVKRRGLFEPILAGMVMSAIGLMGAGVCQDLWQFVLAGIVMGTGAGLSLPEAMTRTAASLRHRGTAFGATHVVTGLGLVAGPLFGGIVVQLAGDVGVAFVLAGVWGLVSLLGWSWHAVSQRVLVWLTVLLCLTVAVVVLFLSTVHRVGKDDGLYRYANVAMGTVVNLTLEADSRTAADNAADKVMAAMHLWQADFDHRDPNGSIGRINRAAGRHWVKPTGRSYDLLVRTLAFSEKTGGIFDPTIGALTASPMYYVFDETMAHARKEFVGWSMVQVDTIRQQVRLEKKGMALDLGGIAKGAIIDMAVALLRKQGVRAGIVEAGGDFYCFGDREWTVGVRHPREDSVFTTLMVREKGVCGSGDYEQFVTTEKHGEKVVQHHIVDPSDMTSADKSIGVTVVADSAELADGLATALFIMGPEKGIKFVSSEYPNTAAVWFTPDLSAVATGNFPDKKP